MSATNPAKKVLVIDDDPEVREFCVNVLTAKGYEVNTVEQARLAIDAIRKQKPNLIILDVMMERVDSGFTLTQDIAKAFPELPILLFSSILEAASDNFDVHALPAAAFAQKPVSPAELIRLVETLLAQVQRQNARGQ